MGASLDRLLTFGFSQNAGDLSGTGKAGRINFWCPAYFLPQRIAEEIGGVANGGVVSGDL